MGRESQDPGVDAGARNEDERAAANVLHKSGAEDRGEAREDHGRMGRNPESGFAQECGHPVMAGTEVAGGCGTAGLSRAAVNGLLRGSELAGGTALRG